MSKERLKNAKEIIGRLVGYGTYDDINEIEVLGWLIEQAERVQELESESYNAHLERLLDRREQQIKRYREALEFYADEETYETKFATDTDEICDPFTLIELDEGKKARKALEGEE